MAKAKAPRPAPLVKEYLVQAQDPISDRTVETTIPSAEFCATPCPAGIEVANVDNVYVTKDRRAVQRLMNSRRDCVNVRVFWRYQADSACVHECTEEFVPHSASTQPAKVTRQIAAVRSITGRTGW